jgi:tetratricopeptide (TPR) repeat protein
VKKIVHILIVLLVFSGMALQAQSAKQYFKAGEDFTKAMNYADAIDQYTKAIELDPDYEKAYFNRGEAYANTGNHEHAAMDFDRAIVFDDKEAELYYFAGREWYLNGTFDKALDKLSAAIDLKKNFLEAYQIRSKVYVELEAYRLALDDCLRCLKLEEDEKAYYELAQVYEKLEMWDEAEEAYKNSINENRRIVQTHFALAGLLYEREKYSEASNSIIQVLQMEPYHLDGILLQSQILSAQGNYPKASEVLSMASIEYPDEPSIYIYRGDINRQMNQPAYAILDYSKAIELSPDSADYYYKRAGTYEEIRDYDQALIDYSTLLTMSAYDKTAKRYLEEANQRMYEIKREENKPRVSLKDPVADEGNKVDISKEVMVISLTGIVEDESDIKSLQVNGFSVPVEDTGDGFQFLASVNLSNSNQIIIQVSDIYDNTETVIFPIRRTEVDPPMVSMIAPYGSENNILYLDNDEPHIFMEGKIEDESKITKIYVDSVLASYIPSDLNPSFTALVNVQNKRSITVQVEDEYGNSSEIVYTLNRDAQTFANNPMGKTWAIFIENSDYDAFSSLDGPARDVSLMRTALARYQIHNVIHKKNMTKVDLQKFFSIELRDMIRSNRVKSILIWYAGHGKFVNERGYWIPVDASMDDEFTYYNTNALKASMQSYPDYLDHTLVITDACESGPSFYQAMRSGLQERSCDDWESTLFKSSQVFSSAGYELALDNSQFTKTFANVLVNNPGSCVPIEKIVEKVTSAVVNGNRQEPQFGKISGLEDEDGTFFFMPKD